MCCVDEMQDTSQNNDVGRQRENKAYRTVDPWSRQNIMALNDLIRQRHTSEEVGPGRRLVEALHDVIRQDGQEKAEDKKDKKDADPAKHTVKTEKKKNNEVFDFYSSKRIKRDPDRPEMQRCFPHVPAIHVENTLKLHGFSDCNIKVFTKPHENESERSKQNFGYQLDNRSGVVFRHADVHVQATDNVEVRFAEYQPESNKVYNVPLSEMFQPLLFYLLFRQPSPLHWTCLN